ncbi:MAG TPA: response regulator [Chthoniobacterales bacterium]|nr:response regulator [Chthoniobacterales bacterium]
MNQPTTASLQPENHRILVIDDNPSIHQDFRKILSPPEANLAAGLDADEAALFGDTAHSVRSSTFQIDSAFQGDEGLEKVRAASACGAPYAVAFVDVRMPPGWDGIETIARIWKEFPDLQMVVCTAYSDYSWDEISKTIGNTDQMLVLKKPFDNVEVLQMAHALARKWELTQIAARQMEDLEALVNERTAELRAANEELTSEVAERAMAEASLRNSEERFSRAFHGNPLPMAIRRLDISGYLDVNASFAALLGTTRELALAESTQLWTDPGIDARISDGLAERQAIRELSARVRTRAGEMREVLVTAQILKLGDAPYQLLILQDITARLRLENELRQAQKMEAVGRLAAGVAHDFNNILTVILGNTALQLREPQLDEKVSASLLQVKHAAERATALTRQLLAYSRKQIIQRRPLALNGVVEQTVAMLRRIIGEHITLEMRLTADLPPVFADPGSVDQVIMNLALNARDAMPDGGKLTIWTCEVEIDEAAAALNPEAVLGRYICLAVRDTGSGMDSTTVARIFEPFFTTKDPGKGTGMGLATAYGVLKQHGGWIEVESAPQRGTTIRVYFPVSTDAVAAEPDPPERTMPAVAPASTVTILVVEDEDILREFVGHALSVLGYRVLTAANGREALKVWREHRGEIDLLLTDMVMPDSISGRQLAQTLSVEHPGLKVIFTSGYSPELLGTDFEQEKEYGFLAKPYLPERLASAVANHLQRQPAMAS